jgi:hypothetical protein
VQKTNSLEWSGVQWIVVGVQVIAFSEAYMGKVKELIGLPDLLFLQVRIFLPGRPQNGL